MRYALVLMLLTVGTALPCSYNIEKAVYSKHPGKTSALFRFEQDGKVGFINAQGRVVIPPRFVPGWFAEEDFFEGLSPAQQEKDSWGAINEAGAWVVPARYSEVDRFSEGFASVVDHTANLRAYIDKTGKIVIRLPGTVFAGRFSEALPGTVATELTLARTVWRSWLMATCSPVTDLSEHIQPGIFIQPGLEQS